MKIAVAGGHSKVAQGAVGHLNEYTEDRKVKNALIRELKNRGHSVVDCSNEKTTQNAELAEEVRLANASGAELFIAIHFNAGGGTGSECWYYTGSSAGKAHSERVASKMASALGLRNRGAKATKSLYVLRKTSMTAILPEVCFVDTKADANAYNKIGANAVAAAIADAVCNTNAGVTSSTSASSGSSAVSGGSSSIKAVQQWCNNNYDYNQTVDGINGKNTKKGLTIAYQTELNKQFGKDLDVDGIYGSKTHAAGVNVRKGARGNLTRVLQGALIARGYSTKGFDGIFGSGTESAVRAFQKAAGLTVDGIAGKNTFKALLG